MSKFDYYDGGRLVRVPDHAPLVISDFPPDVEVIDEDDPILDTEPCVICGHNPCDCDDQYDRWKDR